MMQHRITSGDDVGRNLTIWDNYTVPLEIEGKIYFSAAELVEELGVVRQTLWRWRQEGKIPAGQRFRGRQWFFTAAEAELVREYAFRIEPIDPGPINQLKLFSGRTGGGT